MSALVPLPSFAPPRGAPTHRKLWIALLLALVVLAWGAWKAVGLWQDARALAAIEPHVKLASVYVTRVLQNEFADENPVTLGEFIRTAEGAVDEIGKASATLRAHARPQGGPEIQALAYMGEAQALLRELARLARIGATIDVYRVRITRLEEEANAAGATPQQLRSTREELLQVLRDTLTVLGQAQASAESADKHLTQVTAQQAWVRSTFGDDAVVPPRLLQLARGELDQALGQPARPSSAPL